MFKESASVEASFEFVGRCVSSYRCHHSAREADLLTRDGLMPMLSAAWKARVRFRTWRKTDHTRCLKHINKAEHMSTRGCVALLSFRLSCCCVIAGKTHNAKSLRKCALMDEANVFNRPARPNKSVKTGTLHIFPSASGWSHASAPTVSWSF